MIPKRIHYCWFSHDTYPESIRKCIASWHEYMPDYEFVLWDSERVNQIDSIWLKECLAEKKWAFAADFVRVYALYWEGGIYLDTDVFVYRSFDPLLNDSFFIGREGVIQTKYYEGVQSYLTSHCFGAEPGHSFLRLTLDYYQTRHFITGTPGSFPEDLRYDMEVMPYIQSRLAEPFGWNPNITATDVQHLTNGVVVYPERFFGLKGNQHLSDDTYAHHLALGGWRGPDYQEGQNYVYRYTFSYKIRWRLVRLLRYFATKMGYYLVRIVPDHEYE